MCVITCLQPEQGDEDAFPYLQILPSLIFILFYFRTGAGEEIPVGLLLTLASH